MRKRNLHNAPISSPMSARVAVTDDELALVSQDRIRHAAHYMYNHPARGHDLDRWIVQAASQPTQAQLSALGLPDDAEWSTGHIDPSTGRQHWVYLAKRPLSEGTCDRCNAGSSAPRGLS